jgi:hypothetical protein
MNPLAYSGKGSRIRVQTIPGQGNRIKDDHLVLDQKSALHIFPQIIEKITRRLPGGSTNPRGNADILTLNLG